MKQQNIRIQHLGHLSSTDMIKKVAQLSEDELEYYKRKQRVYEQFEVSMDNHHWMVMKNNDQVNEFAEYLEKKYGIDGKDLNDQNNSQNNPKTLKDKILSLKKSFSFNNVNTSIRIIEKYTKLLSIDYNDQKISEFFQLYDIEFNKVKSLRLTKKSGGRYVDRLCCNCSWKERSFVITQNGLLYYKNKNEEKRICEYISFNKYFEFQYGMKTGYEFGILVKSYHRKLKLSAKNLQDFVFALYFIKKTFDQYNIGKHHNLYGAFSAPKDNNQVEFLVDGEQYFGSVAKAISGAKHDVMIAGWWISPQFYLIRPIDPTNPEKNRLSTILKEIIRKNNVKIYILAYRQSPLFLPNDSKYTKEALQSISSNIKVITHPINLIPSLWSHHQKIVVVDQRVAFIGGMDLCYGRYDTSQHSIGDKENLYPGIEFNNSRIKDFQKVRQYEMSNIMRSTHPRLPWHDVSMKIVGGSVSDVVKHFVEYWNFASYESLYQQRIVLVPETTKIKTKIKNMVVELKNKIWNPKDQSQSENEDRKNKRNRRNSNDNTVKNMLGGQMQDRNHPNPNKKLQNLMRTQYTAFESGQQLMEAPPTHQNPSKQPPKLEPMQKMRKQQSLPQKASIRQNIRKFFRPDRESEQSRSSEEEYYDSDNGQYLNERSYDFEKEHEGVIKNKPKYRWSWMLNRVESYDQRAIGKKPTRKNDKNGYDNEKKGWKDDQRSIVDILTNQKTDLCQVLRSVAKWSIGCKQTEIQASIHEAYIDMIKNAEHFIYIENQFFMSAIEGQKVLKNQVAKTLIERISRAIEAKEKFKVIIFMPLIPGFAGELDHPDAILPRVIMHWQFLTIFNGQNSLIKSIVKLTPDPSKYIQFYSLRTHDLIRNEPKTEIIYLHTKLMIVDDKKAILGSANINDRSLRGARDSQIAITVSGGKMVDSVVNGKPDRVSEKLRNLRMKLMKEHFGSKDFDGRALDFTDMLDTRMSETLQKMAEVLLFSYFTEQHINLPQVIRVLSRQRNRDFETTERITAKTHSRRIPQTFKKHKGSCGPLSLQILEQGKSFVRKQYLPEWNNDLIDGNKNSKVKVRKNNIF